MRSVVLGLAVLIASGMAWGNGPGWNKEPKAVFGIPIGGELKPEDLRDCGGVMNSSGDEAIAACAIKRPMFGDGAYVIGGFPVQAFTEGAIEISGGLVQSVLLKSRQADFQNVKEILIERYGKPSKDLNAKFETNGGKMLSSRVLMWIGPTVSITFAERSGSVDTSSTSFTSTRNLKKADQEIERKRKADASKM